MNFKTNLSNERPLIRIFNDRSLQNFSFKCSNIEWDRLGNLANVDSKFDFLQNSLITVFNESLPLVQKSRKKETRVKNG